MIGENKIGAPAGDRLALLVVPGIGFASGVAGLLVAPGGVALTAVWGGFVALSLVGGIVLGWQFVRHRSAADDRPAPETPPLPEPLRREVREGRADGHCEFCRAEPESLSVEHVTPRADGGTNVRTNLVALCPTCLEKVADGVYDRSELRDKVRRRENPEKTML